MHHTPVSELGWRWQGPLLHLANAYECRKPFARQFKRWRGSSPRPAIARSSGTAAATCGARRQQEQGRAQPELQQLMLHAQS